MGAQKIHPRKVVLALALAVLTTGIATAHIFVIGSPPLLNVQTTTAVGSPAQQSVGGNDVKPIQLTTGKSNDTSPAISPDSKLIAFSSNKGSGSYQVWVMSAVDGSHLVRLTSLTGNATNPLWSSDSLKLAFVEQTETGYQLWSINKDGSGLKNLTGIESTRSAFGWSMKGEQIVFAKSVGQNSIIQIADQQSQGTVKLIPCPSSGLCYDPAFSRDGTSVVFVAKTIGEYALFVYNVENGTTSKIIGISSLNVSEIGTPHFSVDDMNVFFFQSINSSISAQSAWESNWGVMVSSIGFNGSDARNILTPPPSRAYAQTWKPNITKTSMFSLKPDNASDVLLSGYSPSGTADIFLVDEDSLIQEFAGGGFTLTAPGVSVQRLTSLTYSAITGMTWSYDSKTIIFSAANTGSTLSHIYVMRYVEIVQVNPYGQ